MSLLNTAIEAIIFASKDPISVKDIIKILETDRENTSLKVVKESINHSIIKYAKEDYPFEIVNIANGYTFMTKSSFHKEVGTLLKLSSKKKLSNATLETLSIIAYKQPIEKSEIEKIRGVKCDYTVQKLLEKGLVEIIGRASTPGKPLLYGTAAKFMDYFGLKSIKDLPRLEEVEVTKNSIGIN